MTNKQSAETKPISETSVNALSQLQEAGVGTLMGASKACLESFSDMGAELASFVADRIKEDVKIQHAILHCKDVADLQDIQTKFIKKTVEQYQAETGKLVEIGTKAFAPKTDDQAS